MIKQQTNSLATLFGKETNNNRENENTGEIQ